MKARTLASLSCLLGASLAAASDRTVQVPWGTGQHVTAVFSYPERQGKLPAIVIASGRTGGMQADIIKGFAAKATRDGLIAIRFDYSYYADKKEPSHGLVDETDQFNAVLDQVAKDPRVDPKRIVIAGKSLGTVVANRAFAANAAYAGEVLLTPIIDTVEDGQRLYPNLPLSGRPVAVVIGNQDTENAPLGSVYNYFKDASRKIMVDIVAGDHGYELTSLTDPASKRLNLANIDAALETAEYWVRQIAHVPPPPAAPVAVVERSPVRVKPRARHAAPKPPKAATKP